MAPARLRMEMDTAWGTASTERASEAVKGLEFDNSPPKISVPPKPLKMLDNGSLELLEVRAG